LPEQLPFIIVGFLYTLKVFILKRDIIKIDEEKCNGCGQCIPNCHEGALKIIDGKARLVSDVLCDGLGACLGHCPEGAITVEQRDAEPFDEKVVMQTRTPEYKHVESGCPGSAERMIAAPANLRRAPAEESPSELRQWPVQMHLINPGAPYFRNADMLLAADCVAFSVGDFHSRYLKNHSLAIACPKLDRNTDIYVDKLTALIDIAMVNTITVMIMEVPCCSGLMQLVRAATARASRKVPVKQVMISASGAVLKAEWV
jgi:NAD-dependent dihydropyrimidine dehydrogenase PreA subunit